MDCRDTEQYRARWETFESEQLKSLAELSLHGLSKSQLGGRVLALARGGERIASPMLETIVGSMVLENPLLVGAGWDKKGRAVDGLYALGFAGTEVGTVLPHPQAGNPRPRMWYKQGAGLNRLGFNSIGMDGVADNLEDQYRPGVVGISLGKNKLTPDSQAPWAHALVAERMHRYAQYFVINVSSPNTHGLRNLLNPAPLTDNVQAVQSVLTEKGDIPLFVKTTVDLAPADLDNVLRVCIDNGVTGVIDSNTSIDEILKAQYGWQGQAGGVSGDNFEYRRRATERMKHITRETRGTGLQRIGVGAINSAEAAIERIEAGAQAVQVVTAIRQRKGRVATDINLGILKHMDANGHHSIEEFTGIAA